MILPKYNFYVGEAALFTRPNSNASIDNSGNYSTGAASDMYAFSKVELPANTLLFFNLVSLNGYNCIFFYDKDQKFIMRRPLSLVNNAVIVPPANAEYFAARFTIADANFAAKKDTRFVYYITRVEPHYKDLNKKYAKESGQEFFRVSLDGKINLFGAAYEIVKQSGIESQLIFIIEKYNRKSGKYLGYYKGEFNKTDCKFDYEKKKCELKTTAIDEYSEIMNKYDNTYDLIKLAPEITKIDLHKRSLMQVYVRGANSVTNFFGGTYWEDDVNEAIDNHKDLIDKYYFSYIKAGNEFYVKQAGISAANGVYAGTNNEWACWNGYIAKFNIEKKIGTIVIGASPIVYDTASKNSRNAKTASSSSYYVTYAENLYKLCIVDNNTNKIIYKSEKLFYFSDSNNVYIDRDDIVMVNTNDSTDTFTIETVFVYHIYRRLLCDVDTVEDSEGVKNTYDLPINDFVTDNRNYKKCIGLKGGLFFCTSRAVDKPTKYGLNDYGQYFTNQFIPSSSGLGRPLPISKNSWANASLWYVYDSFYEIFEEKLRKQYTLKNSYSIGAAIKAILKKIDPAISHEPTAEYSQFLYGNNNPLGLDRFYVYITQKTNILKGNYDQPAQKAEISLEELMKMLRDCFRCYWYIEDNKFKIEHIHFFMNGGSYSGQSSYQLDFTKLTDQFNKKLSSYFQSEVEFEKSDLNQRYEFAWMDDVTELFGGVTIDVKSNYVQKDKTEEINIGQFSSDVDYMLFNPSNFSDDGFALLCAIPDIQRLAFIETGYYDKKGTLVANSKARNTGLIPIEKYTKLKYKVGILPNVSTVYTLWNENKEFVASLALLAGNIASGTVDFRDRKYSLVRYVALSCYSANGTFSQYEGELSSDTPKLPIVTVDNLMDENGDKYRATIQNWYASWIYLQRLYMYDMPARNIESNVIENLYVQDTKKCMKHTIEFPSEEDLDELGLIKTALGNGKIDEMSFNINTRQTKINLLYKPK